MERLLISGGTLTEHTAAKAGTGEFIYENDMGAWVYGDARSAGSFSAKVQLFTKETDIVIAGACAYASSYPPVGNWLSDTKLGFTGTPMYEITLTDGSATMTVEAGSTFLLPCSYTVSSFTDRTGAPGIINCKAPANLKFTPPTATICAGATVTLTASAGSATSYSINGTDWQAEEAFEVAPTSTTAYTLYAKTAEGCVASLTNAAVVTVNPVPTDLTLTATPTTICKDESATLTASATGGASYSINNSTWQAEADFNETPLLTTAYTLYVKTTAGCSATLPDAATVTVAPALGVPNMGGGGTYCNSVNITATPGTNGTGIRWTDDSSTLTTRNVGAGAYSAVTTSSEGCESSLATVSVIVRTAGAEGHAPDATCGCAVGLLNCAGTCRPSCCTGNVSVTMCEGFTMVTAAADQGCAGEVLYSEAVNICTALGAGWHLPDLGEAMCLRTNWGSLVGAHNSGWYFTSSACTTSYGNGHYLYNVAGYQPYGCTDNDATSKGRVRCVRN
jgi:hypothetical protein